MENNLIIRLYIYIYLDSVKQKKTTMRKILNMYILGTKY